MLTPQEIDQLQLSVGQFTDGVVSVNPVLRPIVSRFNDLLSEYSLMVNAMLYYSMIQCPQCGHFNLPDETTCRVCSTILEVPS